LNSHFAVLLFQGLTRFGLGGRVGRIRGKWDYSRGGADDEKRFRNLHAVLLRETTMGCNSSLKFQSQNNGVNYCLVTLRATFALPGCPGTPVLEPLNALCSSRGSCEDKPAMRASENPKLRLFAGPPSVFQPIFAAAVLLLFTGVGFPAEYIRSTQSGWPQFRGPERNGISRETGLLETWPGTGPALLWSVTNLGNGYSSPVMSGNALYITGDVSDDLVIYALDLEGKLLWRATNGSAWKGPYPGARASCTYSTGKVYHMNSHGQVACFDALDGRLIWTADISDRFESKKPTWGYAECLLVYENNLIVTPGGLKASMCALDKDTGKTVWTAEPLRDSQPGIEGPAYAPPVLVEMAGQLQIVGATARHFFGVAATDGKLLWHVQFPTRHEVLGSSPVAVGDGIFVTGPDSDGGKFFRLKRDDGKLTAEQAWSTTLDTCHGGIIALDGFLYGSWYRRFNGWGCVDSKDGSVTWRSRELPMGSAIYADGRLYCLSQTGIMALVRPRPEAWEVVSRFQFVSEHRNDVWAHPVLLDGKLYLRYHRALHCFDVRQ
jgi:outer membrane protein assembly factor BamB